MTRWAAGCCDGRFRGGGHKLSHGEASGCYSHLGLRLCRSCRGHSSIFSSENGAAHDTNAEWLRRLSSMAAAPLGATKKMEAAWTGAGRDRLPLTGPTLTAPGFTETRGRQWLRHAEPDC